MKAASTVLTDSVLTPNTRLSRRCQTSSYTRALPPLRKNSPKRRKRRIGLISGYGFAADAGGGRTGTATGRAAAQGSDFSGGWPSAQ